MYDAEWKSSLVLDLLESTVSRIGQIPRQLLSKLDDSVVRSAVLTTDVIPQNPGEYLVSMSGTMFPAPATHLVPSVSKVVLHQ
jgi:hypothetical protein